MKNVLESIGAKPGKYIRIVTVALKQGTLSIPVHVIRGKKDGPVLVAAAGEHSQVELNGVAAIDRTFRDISCDHLRGTLVAVPVINPRHVLNQGDSPESGKWDTFRTWPGDANGTPAERITANLTKAVMDNADAVINIHAWSWWAASCAFTSARNRQAVRLTRAFGLPFVIFNTPYCYGDNVRLHPKHNMLTHYILAHGKPGILVELRTQGWLFPDSVEAGRRGLRNAMISLGMISGNLILPPVQFEATREKIVSAPCKGLYVPVKEIADRVKKNELLGYIYNLETGSRTEVKSPCGGAVWLNSRVRSSLGTVREDVYAYTNKGDMLALIKYVRAR